MYSMPIGDDEKTFETFLRHRWAEIVKTYQIPGVCRGHEEAQSSIFLDSPLRAPHSNGCYLVHAVIGESMQVQTGGIRPE
jgi:hypothetical protein